MKIKLFTPVVMVLAASLFVSAHAQNATTKPGNCAIYAEMSAQTVKKDARFKGHDEIAPALMKFSKAQSAKLEASMAETYANSKAFGWDKAKVDAMIIANQEAVHAGFFTATMDTSKLYMDHVQAIYACGSAQTVPADLGQSPEVFTAVLQKMAQIVKG